MPRLLAYSGGEYGAGSRLLLACSCSGLDLCLCCVGDGLGGCGLVGLALRADTELAHDLALDLERDRGVGEEEVARVLLALAELVAVVGVPGARLANDLVLDTEVDERAFARDADAVQDVELGLLE